MSKNVSYRTHPFIAGLFTGAGPVGAVVPPPPLKRKNVKKGTVLGKFWS